MAEAAFARLRIGAEDAALDVVRPGQATRTSLWALGIERLRRDARLGDPPRASALEAAIAHIEDVVMVDARAVTGVSRLALAGGSWDRLQAAAGAGAASPLSIDAVEVVFRALAEVAEGRPAASAGVPTDPATVATVLIVREAMHHLGFETVERAVG